MTTTFQADDDIYPGTTIVFIEAWWGSAYATGSGVLVGRNDIVTASHVIYSQSLGGTPDYIRVYPSYNPSSFDNLYYDDLTYQFFPDFDPDGDGRLFPGDFRRGTLAESELDLALISLRDPLGDQFGWMGIDWGFTGGNVGVLGHPGVYGVRLMYDGGSVSRSSVDGVYYIGRDLEVNPGNSGGPIYYDYGDGPYAVGVVSTGAAATALGAHRYWLEEAMTFNDRLLTARADETIGTTSNDWFTLDRGIRRVDLGPGYDTLFVDLARSAVDAFRGTTGFELQSRITGERVALVSVEEVELRDGKFLAGPRSGNMDEAYLLYSAAFGRTPDEGGLLHWTNALDRGASLQAVANAFLGAPEYVARYGAFWNQTEASFVTEFYRNILDRAPDLGGLAFWASQLATGFLTHADVLAGIALSPENRASVAGDIGAAYWVV
ncbi:DUF4214 domain-containing protein [Salinarimonas ramus]|uniref:DUF4214 domain-containing protein n=1 Tax=Salinarimonas ramus TaxID=690164 RepID=A0A917Q8N9_9HYPH|nr:DUF4214 domain-containing protein [Salinarimonas ramus]GGK35849.1 hypothetical protein GCM10011322_23520 [Salinarimonas ramus]